MARRGHAYPNVRVVAADFIDGRLGALPERATVRAGLDRASRLGLAALTATTGHGCTALTATAGHGCAVLPDDLRRAAALGLGDLAAADLARPLPVLDAGAAELDVRRALSAGAPLVLVRDGAALVGAVARRGVAAPGALGPSLTGRLAALLDEEGHRLLRRIARLAEGQGSRAFAVGGVVRDAVAGGRRRALRDLDVVVEGDGIDVARQLADESRGQLAVHPRFLTASIRLRDDRKVDVATARAERYDAPGALPRVRPAGIAEDLERRDFAVNAMAAELSSGAFHLVDPLGGRRDLAERRLRVLHPLSFVEDPTRLFRAARYGVRLGLTLDPWTAACRRVALRCAPFAALSGARLIGELERILDEPQAGHILARLPRDGTCRLLARDYRGGATVAGWLGELGAAQGWARRHAVPLLPLELLLLALVGDQAPRVVAEALDRLAVTGEPRARLLAAVRDSRRRQAGLRAAPRRSAAAQVLRGRPGLELAWLWLTGDAVVRRRATRFAGRDAAVKPWLDGDEVVALGIPRGPAVARVLGALRDGRLDGTLRDRAAAARLVRRLRDRRGRGGNEGMTGGQGG